MSQHSVVLLLGSNLGDRYLNLETAIALLNESVGDIYQKSEILETIPVDYDSNKNFCNIALRMRTYFSPVFLLMKLKKIEVEMGRIVDSGTSGVHTDRTIDIDIVYYEGLNFVSERLIIPHFKHIIDRDFSKKLISQLEDTNFKY